MTIALDFGSACVKAILFGLPRGGSRYFSFSLNFKTPILSRATLISALEIIGRISGEKIFDRGKPLAKIYVCLGLPVYEDCDLLQAPVLLTGQAFSSLEINILDVGSQFVHFNDRVGINPIDVSAVANWLPFKAEVSDIASYVENKKIYSSILPTSPRDLYIEQAIARVRIMDILKAQQVYPDIGELYLTGAVFSKAPYLEQAILMVLDSLQPQDMIKLWLDKNQILPMAGLLKYYSTSDYLALSDELSPIFLGTAISLVDSCEVKIDLGMGESQSITLTSGDLYIFPLKSGEQASVKVEYKSSKSPRKTYEVTGGEVGVVFDLRGRPLIIPESASSRQELLRLWDNQIGASGQIERI